MKTKRTTTSDIWKSNKWSQPSPLHNSISNGNDKVILRSYSPFFTISWPNSETLLINWLLLNDNAIFMTRTSLQNNTSSKMVALRWNIGWMFWVPQVQREMANTTPKTQINTGPTSAFLQYHKVICSAVSKKKIF